MSNQEIAKLLENVATAYIIKDEKKFKFQLLAYQKAAETVRNLNRELVDYYKDNELESLPGIGPTLRGHLIDLFKNGEVKHFDWVLDGIPKSVFVLTDIPTFGPKKAYRLVSQFNLTDPKTVIEDLKKIAEKGEIAKLEGFGDKSQADVIRAINEFKEGKGKTTRMILPYAYEVAQKLIEYMQKNPDVDRIEALGSFRRRQSTVGDLDFAVATAKPKEVIEYFVNYPSKERIIEKGDVSASILVAGGRQVDLLIQPKGAFGSLLQHFTGSKNHNVALREYALKKNLSLSEYGIKNLKSKDKEIQQYADEEKFYNAIGLSFIPPEIRENTGEIELAEKNKLPKLIELTDIKGDFHIHSSFPIEPSHDLGQNTMEEMLTVANDLGYEYLGFSEHNPSTSKHTNEQIYYLIKRRNDLIDKLNSSKKYIRIFKLLETDILPSGELAVDDKALELLDASIVSIHSVFKMDKDKMTDRVIKGLSHPKAKILAHPTGRLLNDRFGYELDFKRIFKFCKENNKALEINSWPQRLDLPDSLVKEAIENGVKLVIDSDSHAASQMNQQKYGVFVARRGWAKKSDIINSFSYNEITDWFSK